MTALPLRKGITVTFRGVEFEIVDIEETGRMDNHATMTQNIGVQVFLERKFEYAKKEKSDGYTASGAGMQS